MADLSGSWLGTYWQKDQPTRFEATLVQGGNTLTGRILDDNQLGEADVAGDVVGRRVSFVKQYHTATYAINYTGTVAEDENSIQGTWQITGVGTGRWEAHRSGDNLMAALKDRMANKVPETVGAT